MDNPTNGKPNPNGNNAKHARPGKDFYLALIHKLAAAMRVDLTMETQLVYLEQLSMCDPNRIELAINRTIRE